MIRDVTLCNVSCNLSCNLSRCWDLFLNKEVMSACQQKYCVTNCSKMCCSKSLRKVEPVFLLDAMPLAIKKLHDFVIVRHVLCLNKIPSCTKNKLHSVMVRLNGLKDIYSIWAIESQFARIKIYSNFVEHAFSVQLLIATISGHLELGWVLGFGLVSFQVLYNYSTSSLRIMPLGCRPNHIVWHQIKHFLQKNISQSWLTFNFFSRHLLQVLRMLHLNSQLTCILVINKKITIVFNRKYGKVSNFLCSNCLSMFV